MFLKFPVFIPDDDLETRDEHLLGEDQVIIEMNININAICTYNEGYDGYVVVRMANNDIWEIPLKLKDFETTLLKADAVVSLTSIKEN